MSFDCLAIFEQFLRTVRDSQDDNGTVAMVVPADPGKEPAQTGRIGDVSWTGAFPLIAYWIYFYSGDDTIVQVCDVHIVIGLFGASTVMLPIGAVSCLGALHGRP
jgi:hypothetical protein